MLHSCTQGKKNSLKLEKLKHKTYLTLPNSQPIQSCNAHSMGTARKPSPPSKQNPTKCSSSKNKNLNEHSSGCTMSQETASKSTAVFLSKLESVAIVGTFNFLVYRIAKVTSEVCSTN